MGRRGVTERVQGWSCACGDKLYDTLSDSLYDRNPDIHRGLTGMRQLARAPVA